MKDLSFRCSCFHIPKQIVFDSLVEKHPSVGIQTSNYRNTVSYDDCVFYVVIIDLNASVKNFALRQMIDKIWDHMTIHKAEVLKSISVQCMYYVDEKGNTITKTEFEFII